MRLCSQQYVSLVQEYYTELEPVFNECLATDGSQCYLHTMTNANATRQGKEQKEMKSIVDANSISADEPKYDSNYEQRVLRP